MDLSSLYLVWRLLAAVVLGGIVGAERESRNKAAGLRTHMLVALGAATFTVSAVDLAGESGNYDPTRILQGVATGIGFLGAGSILQRKGQVQGLTTAAGIWVVGGIGAACGLGAYGIAIAVSVITAIIMALLGPIEAKIGNNDSSDDPQQRS
jgi:putative Mg2+ transporter-C (MgtC) family protein